MKGFYIYYKYKRSLVTMVCCGTWTEGEVFSFGVVEESGVFELRNTLALSI